MLLDYSKVKESYYPTDVSELIEMKLHKDDFSSIRAISLVNAQFKFAIPNKTLSCLS